MAINYTPIGFNTKTYSNPTTMNHMDNGIKSACDGVDSLSTGKVDKVSGKGLSTEDYTTAEKTKLAGIATGATKTTIKNDLTTTTAGSALDASQGKVLADRITTMQSDTSVHAASGASLSLQTAKGGMRFVEDGAIGGQTHKSKNMIPYPYSISNATYNGVTYTINADGSIALSGKCTTDSVLRLWQEPGAIADLSNKIHYSAGDRFWGKDCQITIRNDDGTSTSPRLDEGKVWVAEKSGYIVGIRYYLIHDKVYNETAYPIFMKYTDGADTSFEPYGIRSAGDGYGCVDLGSLTWSYSNSIFAARLSDAKKPASNYVAPNIVCSIYRTVRRSGSVSFDDSDKVIGISAANDVIIKDSAYTTVSDFVEHIKGIYIAYEPNDGTTPSQYALVVEEVGENGESKTIPIPIPHPVRGIGDVKEMVHKVGQQWVEDSRYAQKNLGELTFTRNANYGFFYAELPDGKYTGLTNGIATALCERYQLNSTQHYINMSNGDFSVGSNLISVGKCALVIKDTSYTDAAAFKAAMSGVMLIYELATPTTEPLPNQAAMYEMESYTEQTHIDTADGLATMAVEYGMSDLMATALNGERIAQKAIAE